MITDYLIENEINNSIDQNIEGINLTKNIKHST